MRKTLLSLRMLLVLMLASLVKTRLKLRVAGRILLSQVFIIRLSVRLKD